VRLALRVAKQQAKLAKTALRTTEAERRQQARMQRPIKETNVPLILHCLAAWDIDSSKTQKWFVDGKPVGAVGDWILKTKTGKFERNLGPMLEAVPFKARLTFSLGDWGVDKSGKPKFTPLTKEQLKEFGLNQYGGRVNDSQQQADLKKHLLAKGKWRDTLGWSRSYSLTFVIPELHRMAIWYVPYHATPEGQKRAGNLTGGIYSAIQNQSDMDAANVVLWKRQHQIAACVGENGQLQFAIWATEEPDPVLVDLIRRGKKIADRQLARSWRFGKGKGYRA